MALVAVSYTHLDVYKRQVYDSMTAFQNKNRKWHDLGYLPRDYK